MRWHKVAFAERGKVRLLRHLLFWVVWWLYFAVCQYIYQQSGGSGSPGYVTVGPHLLLKTFFLVLLAAMATYLFIYHLLPQFINGKWWKAAAKLLVLCVFLCSAGGWLYWTFFQFLDSLFGLFRPVRYYTRFWPAVSLGLWETTKVVAAAGIIKYAKYWWLKQKESERLEQEKINAELQLLKAQIHPNFLFTALNNIHAFSLTASPRAPELLLKLSDMLSYMLYECDEPLVALDKEVEMMKGYLALEKERLGTTIEMELSVQGEITGKTIAPFLLLPFLENSIRQSQFGPEKNWLNIDIAVAGDELTMKLANGAALPAENQGEMPESCLINAKKRLCLIYPQKHDLKISREPEMLLVLLRIELSEAVLPLPGEDSLRPEKMDPQSNLYAAF